MFLSDGASQIGERLLARPISLLPFAQTTGRPITPLGHEFIERPLLV